MASLGVIPIMQYKYDNYNKNSDQTSSEDSWTSGAVLWRHCLVSYSQHCPITSSCSH